MPLNESDQRPVRVRNQASAAACADDEPAHSQRRTDGRTSRRTSKRSQTHTPKRIRANNAAAAERSAPKSTAAQSIRIAAGHIWYCRLQTASRIGYCLLLQTTPGHADHILIAMCSMMVFIRVLLILDSARNTLAFANNWRGFYQTCKSTL